MITKSEIINFKSCKKIQTLKRSFKDISKVSNIYQKVAEGYQKFLKCTNKLKNCKKDIKSCKYLLKKDLKRYQKL